MSCRRRDMTEVYWLEQAGTDVPAGSDWLSEGEALRLSQMRFPKRLADWRLGRWTGKCALAAFLRHPLDLPHLAQIEIIPSPEGAPEAFVAGRRTAATISLSHRAGLAVCAVASSSVALGCDLEIIEPRSDSFVTDYFTAEEQTLIARMPIADQPRLLALLWSAKESTLKALGIGLRADTRSVMVRPDSEWTGGLQVADISPAWQALHVRCIDDQVFHGWWQETGKLMRTLIAAPPPTVPLRLHAFPEALLQART